MGARVNETRQRMSWMGARIRCKGTRMRWMGARIPTARLWLRRSVVETKRMGARMGWIDERFIDAPSVMGLRRPSMNCDAERALAACHDVARHYGDFSVMRKG